jgi:hypothetical protein
MFCVGVRSERGHRRYGSRMEDFVQKMVDKVGIDKTTAEKVIAFLKDHADEAVKYLQSSGLADKLPGGLGDKLGKLF